MARWIKRILVTLLLGVLALLLVAAVLAWRAGRTPDWYAAAVDQTAPDEAGDEVLRRQIVPLGNWLARTSAGNLESKSDAEKTQTLDITDTEINALLAKVLDHRRGPAETFRVRLLENTIELAFTLTEYGRCATVSADVGKAADGSPTVVLGPVRLGEQAAPSWLIDRLTAEPINRLRAYLLQLQRTGRPPHIDERDGASESAMKATYGRLLLNILAGRAVPPPGLLPSQREGDAFVATRVTRLDVTPGRLRATFRMMTPDERAELLAELNGPLPVP